MEEDLKKLKKHILEFCNKHNAQIRDINLLGLSRDTQNKTYIQDVILEIIV